MHLIDFIKIKEACMKTLFDKVWEKHVITGNEGEAQLLYIDLHLIHEVTSPQAFSGLRIAERKVRRPDLTFGTMDHNTPTIMADRYNIADETSKAQLEALKRNCEEFGVELADMFNERNGIVHMVGPELGLTLPGKTVVCGDSHTATHGAFGAIAFGIGTSEVEHVLATQTLWQKKPKTMGIEITGKLQKGVYAKDIILHLIKTYGIGLGNGYAFEFFGDTIKSLSMEERMTICNMAIEAGGKSGIIAPDEITFEYIKNREFSPKGKDLEKKIVVQNDFEEIIISNIINLAGFYKRFFVNNGLNTKVYLFHTDFNSDDFIQKKYNEDYRSYYLTKFNTNPKFVLLTEKLKNEILPDVRTICEFIPDVYYLSSMNIEGSLIPYIISNTNNRKNLIKKDLEYYMVCFYFLSVHMHCWIHL